MAKKRPSEGTAETDAERALVETAIDVVLSDIVRQVAESEGGATEVFEASNSDSGGAIH